MGEVALPPGPANNLWRHEIITDPSAFLTVHSLNLSISLAKLYEALDKLPK